jgi:hypothetical protein
MLAEPLGNRSSTRGGVRVRRRCRPHASSVSGACRLAGGVAQAPIRNSRYSRFMRTLSGRSTHPARVHSQHGPLLAGGSGVYGTPGSRTLVLQHFFAWPTFAGLRVMTTCRSASDQTPCRFSTSPRSLSPGRGPRCGGHFASTNPTRSSRHTARRTCCLSGRSHTARRQ